jgi:hypothetical protein
VCKKGESKRGAGAMCWHILRDVMVALIILHWKHSSQPITVNTNLRVYDHAYLIINKKLNKIIF